MIEMSPSCISYEIMSAMLSIVLCIRSLIALYFSCFKAIFLKNICVTAIVREKVKLIPLNSVSTDKPALLANVAIETPPTNYC